MANKILSESFKVFTKYGYNDGIDDFVKLVNSNPDALNDAYEQYKNDVGFEGTIEEYAAALNQKPATVKKKEQEPSGMELPSEDGSSEQSTPQQPEPPKKPRTYGTLNLPGITGTRRPAQPSAKELAAIGEFAKKTEVKKEKPIEPKRPKLLLVDPTLAAIPQRDVLRPQPPTFTEMQGEAEKAAIRAKEIEQDKEKQRILTTLQFASDKEKEFEQRKEREQEAAELLASTDFNNVLSGITPGLIDQEETKVASELTNRLARFGFSFSEAEPGFNAIYVTAKKSGGKIPSIQINLGDKDAEQKLKNFVKQYASKPYQYTPTDRQIDIEGQQFYASRGLDYKNERARQDEYYNIRDKRIAAESIDPDDRTTYNETMRQKFPDLFLSNGAPRLDMSQVASELLAEEDRLYATVFDKGVSRDAREQWDVELEKKRKEAAATAAIKNNVAKNVIKDVNTYLVENLPGLAEIPSTGLYTQPIEKLMKYKPKTEAEADIANEAIRRYTEAAKISKEAADQYQLSQLYFDEKINKAVQGEYVENIEGLYKSIHDAWKEGKTGVTLQKIRDGLYDRLDNTDIQEAAKEIVDAQITKYNQQSAVMGRADAAVSTREYLDAILEDPFEYVTTLVTSSLTQALPNIIYAAMKVVPVTAAGGTVIPGVGTAAGIGFGLKRARELASLSMEFTSAFTQAMKDNNLDILNPNDVVTAIQSDAIWEEAKEVGFKRGIPIALMDYVGGRVAGRLFKVGDYASQAAKTGAQVAERFVVDPILEGSGEALAQLVSSGDIDWKEVSAEAIGGVGGNVTGMAANIYMDTQGKANIEIADNLTNIEYVANETASDERISNWANNMHRLGKIDADVNQRIQENIGHKRSAENLLDVGADKRERKDKSPLVARMMKLLAAEKELSSTEERRKVFSDKLSAIRKEQAYIADKQQLAPDDAKVDVDAIIKEQPQPGNYSYNGRRMTKAQFTERIEKMSPQKLANAVARKRLLVTGDPEVVKTINDKLNAVQKPTTKEGVLRQEGPEVELREMGERDAEGQAPQAPITYTQEEVTKRKDELTTKLEQLTKEAEAAPDDTELAGRVAEVKQQVAGMEAIGRRLETQENVKKSIASIYPDLEIVEVNNAKEMEDYVAANVDEKTRKQMIGGEGGVIIFGADGKPESIIINNEVADSTTMPHEAWHGILFKAFGDNPELFAEFRASIDKALRDNGFGDIADRLDQFVSENDYAPEQMAEEWLVELGGLLVSQGIDVKNLKPNEATLLQQIKDIINAFAERIIGQPVFLKDATPENILDFMVTISERMRKGESIADFFGEEGNVTKASTDIKASRKVFHGSPYDFERFDISKIGTGEGAQAFGWGLYFTELEDIAKHYANDIASTKTLNKDIPVFADIAIIQTGTKNKSDLIKNLTPKLTDNIHSPIAVQKAIDYVNNSSQQDLNKLISSDKVGRNLYEVTLHEGKTPDQYTWLDWDEPVTEKQRKLIIEQADKEGVDISNVDLDGDGKSVYTELGQYWAFDKGIKEHPKEVSLFLLRAGIDGVRYPAESIARGITSETARGFNYVVFDDKAVTIEKKVKFSRKAPALQTVEATAKALEEEVKKESVIKNLGYVPYEKAIIVEAQTEFKNLPKGEGEGVAEARSRMMREQESTPPKFTQYPIGTRAIDKFGEVIELREVPLDEAVSKDEGTQSQETIDKYAKWIKEGKSMPPAKGVENFAVENGKVKITDGNHRYAAAKKAGLKSLPIWVALTDAENVARPVYARNEIAEAYHAAKKDGSNPELVNAVEELLGGEEKKVKFSRKPIMTDVVNGFYSPLENAVAAVKQDKMPAKQWMKYTNMEEAKWTGLNDWLLQQEGSVSKQDILNYLKGNRINIAEVVNEQKVKEIDQILIDETYNNINEELSRRGIDDIDEIIYAWYYRPTDENWAEVEKFLNDNNIDVDYVVEKSKKDTIEDTTKYSEYQLGGDKDDYKEVLVTLPKKVSKGTVEQNEDGTFSIRKTDGTLTSKKWSSFEAADKYNESATKSMATDFKSTHFDEPNILVHLRMNTRTDANGNKVLFLEEVQSDWGQEGKKRGFKQNFDKNKVSIEWTPEYGTNAKGEKYPLKNSFTILYDGSPISGKIGGYYETDQDALNYAIKVAEKDFEKRKETKIPTAPFVMDTNAWVKLGVKVALKEAEKQGADYIAWTTGEQQNERYDLRKQVDSILWERDDDGTYAVSAEKDGSTISSQTGLTSLKLEEAIGKDAAEKIVNSTDDNGVLEGNDLAVGGKGMKSFYDKIVPDVAKAVIKDVTGTPGEITSVTIETDKGKSTQMAIAVTPEVKGAVKGGMAKFSRKKQDQKPPSVAKLLGITDKKIEIKEKTALANQLKAEARGARNAVKAWKDRAKLLADELKQLKGSNKINQPQYIAALRALVKVNIFNEDSISKFVDYVTKVINNAEYAKQIADLRKALPVAKKNVDRKLGMQPNLQAVLKKVFAVSPSMIPDAVFDKYVNLVNMIGERARVLNLDEQSSIMADATAIATMIDHEQFLAQMLKDAFDNYRDKVLDSNGDVDYQKTIEKMVSDGIIQPSDIELMKKYKGLIVPKEPKTEAEIQAEAAEREQERQDFISSIPGQTVTPSNLSTPDEKAGAKELIELSKDAQVLERMTLEQLRNLDKVLDNIANGFYPAYAHTLKEVMNGIKSSEGVRKAMPKIKIPAIRSMIGKLKAALMKGENMYYHVLSKVPLYIIDQQLGNYKTSPIYKNIFEKVAIAQSKLASKQKQLLSQLDKAADAVFKEAKRDPDKARMSEYRIFTYLLHREFMSNPGAKGVADAVNFIKATIEYHEENGDTAQVNSRDVDMLQKILDEYESNGKLDFAKLERSLTPKERAYVDALDKVNNEVYPMAEYTASVLRGESVPMLNNYVHHRVLPSKKAVGEQPNELMKANQRMNPSSRSGSLISREPGVKPLNFKVFSTQKAAVNSVLVDRFMTEPIRTTRRMFESLKRSLKDDGMLRGHNRDIVAALEMAFEKANEALLTNNLMYDTFMDEVISSVRRDAYRALLARPTRAIVEYASNLSAALAKSTGAFIDGMSMKGAMSQEELGAFMYSVNSAQVSRVMPSSDMSSKFIDFGATGPAIGRQGSTANSSLANRMLTIYNRTLRRYKGGVDSVADALISTPDKAVSQPVWTGSFYNQFKKITGVNPDKDKIISGDEAYMERYKDAIKSATEKADEEVFMLSSVDNPYMGILNTLKSANDSPMRKAYKMFNNFLTRFQINDYVNARAAVNAMVNNGKMSKADGARLLVAITLRSVVYIALGKIAIEAMLSAIVDREPEEEDDRSYMEIAGNALASSMTTLMLGRAHGNLLRGIIGMGVEEINEEHLGFMRRGAYDPSRDAIQFGLIPKYSMDDKQGFGLWDVIKSMSGPFGPMVNTIDNALKAATKDLKEPDAVRRAEQTLMIRTPFELLGNLGWIPAYGDIRKIIVADINKGIGKKAKPKEPTWRELPKSERAEIRRLDPKAADEMIKEQKEIDRINKMIRKQEQRYR